MHKNGFKEAQQKSWEIIIVATLLTKYPKKSHEVEKTNEEKIQKNPGIPGKVGRNLGKL